MTRRTSKRQSSKRLRKNEPSTVCDIRIGDEIAAYGRGTNTASLTGDVVKVGRVNVQVHSRVRFSPVGPWYEQEHKVPKHFITHVMRDGVLIYKHEHE